MSTAHSAPVVRHLNRAVFKQDHIDTRGITGNGLIGAVVNDFLSQMVRTAGVSVYIPGRRLTGSRPSKTSTDEAVYCEFLT